MVAVRGPARRSRPARSPRRPLPALKPRHETGLRQRVLPAAVPSDPRERRLVGQGLYRVDHRYPRQPNFAGHVQPFLPADLGFYDLRVTEVWVSPVACLHQKHGSTLSASTTTGSTAAALLEKAARFLLLERPDVPFRYYLCWANEAWTSATGTGSTGVLVDQPYGGWLRDGAGRLGRCRTSATRATPGPIGRRPRFVIYRPTDLPDPATSVARMREAWAKAGP